MPGRAWHDTLSLTISLSDRLADVSGQNLLNWSASVADYLHNKYWPQAYAVGEIYDRY